MIGLSRVGSGDGSLVRAMIILGMLGLISTAAPARSDAHAQAREQSVAVSAQVEAGNWQGIRLQNLPKGAKLAIRLVVEHQLRAIVIDDDQFDGLPQIEWPLAAMTGTGKLDFTVILPESGTYYLILDNRAGIASSRVAVSVTAIVE